MSKPCKTILQDANSKTYSRFFWVDLIIWGLNRKFFIGGACFVLSHWPLLFVFFCFFNGDYQEPNCWFPWLPSFCTGERWELFRGTGSHELARFALWEARLRQLRCGSGAVVMRPVMIGLLWLWLIVRHLRCIDSLEKDLKTGLSLKVLTLRMELWMWTKSSHSLRSRIHPSAPWQAVMAAIGCRKFGLLLSVVFASGALEAKQIFDACDQNQAIGW